MIPCRSPISPGSCITVDHTNPDDFLCCMRTQFPFAKCHANTVEAVANLGKCSGELVDYNLVGHGQIGIIITGTGRTCVDSPRCVDIGDEDIAREAWEKLFAGLKGKARSLALWSCDSGATDLGAKFLFDLAKQLDAQASAPTGILCCNAGRLFLPEDGACWQTADPHATEPPPAIDLPLRSRPRSGVERFFMFPDAINQPRFKLKTVPAVTYYSEKQNGRSKDLHGIEATELLEAVDFENPSIMDCSVAAVLTGRLVLHMEPAEPRSFTIYNNRLLVDEKDHQVHYYGFRDFIVATKNLELQLR